MNTTSIIACQSNPVFLSWCAAWVEAEGCLSLFRRGDISQSSFQVKVSIAQCNTEPLEMIWSGFPDGRIHKTRNGISHLQYSSTKAIDFLRPLLPYFTYKRERADILIAAQEIISKRYGRWSSRPLSEVQELFRLKDRLHDITKTSLSTRQKQIGGRSNSLNGKWSTKFDFCVACGSNKSKHAGRGLCRRCYSRQWAKQ